MVQLARQCFKGPLSNPRGLIPKYSFTCHCFSCLLNKVRRTARWVFIWWASIYLPTQGAFSNMLCLFLLKDESCFNIIINQQESGWPWEGGFMAFPTACLGNLKFWLELHLGHEMASGGEDRLKLVAWGSG